jgi:hypothetical protein
MPFVPAGDEQPLAVLSVADSVIVPVDPAVNVTLVPVFEDARVPPEIDQVYVLPRDGDAMLATSPLWFGLAEDGALMAGAAGGAPSLTVTTGPLFDVQPFPSVTVSVYVVSDDGLAFGVQLDALSRPVIGVQKHDTAPDPLSVADPPAQIVTVPDPWIAADGRELTVITALPVPAADALLPSVTVVTVYVVTPVPGLTVRSAGLVVTPFCWDGTPPSDHTRFQGGVPVRNAWIVADPPAQMDLLPDTVADTPDPVIEMFFVPASDAQPEGDVSTTESSTVPGPAPAVNVMLLPVSGVVGVPFVTDHRYVAPACEGTLATSPVWPPLADGGAVITGADGFALTVTVTGGLLLETQPFASVTVSV